MNSRKGTVGRKTRRAPGLNGRWDRIAPVLSRSVGRLVQGAPELRGNPKQTRDCSYTRSSNPAQDNRIAEQRLNRAEIFALPFFAVVQSILS